MTLSNPKSEGIEVKYYQMNDDCGTSSVYYPVDKILGPIDSIITQDYILYRNFLIYLIEIDFRI